MNNHLELGSAGEKIVQDYLQDKGYKILDTNWRYRHKEIDIIALEKNTLVIVEVKSRKHTYLTPPQAAVNRQKQKFLIEAANAYIEKYKIDKEIRFDVICVVFNQKTYKLEHIKDAFYPIL